MTLISHRERCGILVWLTAPMLTSTILTFMNSWGPHGKKNSFENTAYALDQSLWILCSYRNSACVCLVSLLWTVTSLRRMVSLRLVLGVMTQCLSVLSGSLMRPCLCFGLLESHHVPFEWLLGVWIADGCLIRECYLQKSLMMIIIVINSSNNGLSFFFTT